MTNVDKKIDSSDTMRVSVGHGLFSNTTIHIPNRATCRYTKFIEPVKDVMARFAGQQFSTFKGTLADLAVSKLSPITAEMRRLMADPAEIDRLLAEGAEKAAAIADPIVHEVKKIVGFAV